MFKYKNNKLVLGLLLSTMILGACGNGDAEGNGATNDTSTEDVDANDTDDNVDAGENGDTTSEEDITIDFWHIYSDGPMAELIPELIEEFEADNQHITVDHLGTNFWDYFTRLNTAVAGGVGPDLAMNDTTTLTVRAQNNVIVNIDDFINEDDFNTDDFYPILMEMMEYEGSYYGLASDTDVRVLYYNRAHFEEAGLDPDSPPTNWEEWEEYTEALTIIDDNGLVEQMGFSAEIGISNMSLHTLGWTNGGDWWDEEGKPTFTEPENVEALEFMERINNIYGENAMSAFRSQASALDYNPFIAETVSMVVETNNLLQDIERYNPDMDYGIATIPYNVEPVTYSAGFNYEIIDNDDDASARAAWEFMKFLTSEDVQLRIHNELGNLVSNINAAESEELMQNENWVSIVEEMEHARFIEFINELPTWNSTLNSAEEAVLQSNVSPEDALQEAQEIAEDAVN